MASMKIKMKWEPFPASAHVRFLHTNRDFPSPFCDVHAGPSDEQKRLQQAIGGILGIEQAFVVSPYKLRVIKGELFEWEGEVEPRVEQAVATFFGESEFGEGNAECKGRDIVKPPTPLDPEVN